MRLVRPRPLPSDQILDVRIVVPLASRTVEWCSVVLVVPPEGKAGQVVYFDPVTKNTRDNTDSTRSFC
jgi:hypothetical protein